MKKTALEVAHRIGIRSRKDRFDWENIKDVSNKVIEELHEVLDAHKNHPKKTEEELGDLLFATAQLCRHLDVHPERALRKANTKFEKRYQKMLKLSGLSLKNFSKLPLVAKEKYWSMIKKTEKK